MSAERWNNAKNQNLIDYLRNNATSEAMLAAANRIEDLEARLEALQNETRPEPALTGAQETQKLQRDADLLKTIIDLCGYVQNGTDAAVTLLQDDATREWLLRINSGGGSSKFFHGHDAKSAIESAKQALS